VIISTGIALFELLFAPVSKRKKFNERPFGYHQEIELTISTLTNLGVGLGRVELEGAEGARKWVVMVAFSLPGERVRARVFRNHANYSEADLVRVLEASPDRIEPRCPLFGRCGGCQYQNLRYEEQLAWKRRQVAELVEHMAGLTLEVSAVIGSPRPFGYRSKITPHFNGPRQGEELAIGFLRQGTRFEIVDVPRCDIATDAINARLASERAAIRSQAAAGGFARGSTLLIRDAGGGVTTSHEDRVTEEIALAPGETLRLSFLARDFFQNNPFILPSFAAYVRDQARSSGARFLVDAYCGSGLFALASARAFERVIGVEVSETSIAFARQNAAANAIGNATFLAGDASSIFSGLDFPAAETVVVIDPPRKGCDEPFLRQLFAFGPRAVVYVSCDPATQMRDLKGFLAEGYSATAVQPFDLFPQTRHLECVITLARAGYCQGEAGSR
jgi:23S rRNA (uracil1939-C5)-methyltransferase/tRNA (uracil-5-)-methyltransferase